MDKFISVEQLYEARKNYTPTNEDNSTWTHRGVELPNNASDATMADLENWKARTSDVFIITYPKAGTTWASEMASCIIHNGDMDAVRSRHITSRVPFLELVLPGTPSFVPPNHKLLDDVPSPRLIKTHLPGPFLPPQILTKKPKIVYVLRNPKDLAVSLFYFGKAWQQMGFHNFLKCFMSGKVDYGPWYDHYLYFWARRSQENILIIKYEDMQMDLSGIVAKMAHFMGKTLTDDTMGCIAHHCEFNNMKANDMSNMDTVRPLSKHQFMRKGTVGDWKNHFTVADNDKMDAFIGEKMADTGLTFDFA